MIELEEPAREESTYLITVTCYDEDGNAVTPTELKWSLSDDAGAVINMNKDVAATPANPTEVLLKGADLAFLGAEDLGKRRFTARGKYNSNRGTDLPVNEEAWFTLERLVNVPAPA